MAQEGPVNKSNGFGFCSFKLLGMMSVNSKSECFIADIPLPLILRIPENQRPHRLGLARTPRLKTLVGF